MVSKEVRLAEITERSEWESGEGVKGVRTLQVDGGAPLNLGLAVSRIDRVSFVGPLAILIGVGLVALVFLPRRREA